MSYQIPWNKMSLRIYGRIDGSRKQIYGFITVISFKLIALSLITVAIVQLKILTLVVPFFSLLMYSLYLMMD